MSGVWGRLHFEAPGASESVRGFGVSIQGARGGSILTPFASVGRRALHFDAQGASLSMGASGASGLGLHFEVPGRFGGFGNFVLMGGFGPSGGFALKPQRTSGCVAGLHFEGIGVFRTLGAS